MIEVIYLIAAVVTVDINNTVAVSPIDGMHAFTSQNECIDTANSLNLKIGLNNKLVCVPTKLHVLGSDM